MDAGVVEAAAALVPHRAEAGDAVLKTMLAVLNAVVDLLTALDVVPDLIPHATRALVQVFIKKKVREL